MANQNRSPLRSGRLAAIGAIILTIMAFQNCSGGLDGSQGDQKLSSLTPPLAPGPAPSPGPAPGPAPGPNPSPAVIPIPFSALTHIYLNASSLYTYADGACMAGYVGGPGPNKETLCSQNLGTGNGNVISDIKIVAQGQACPAGYQLSGTHLSWQNSGAPQYYMPVCLLLEPSATASRFTTDLYAMANACAPGDLEIGHEQYSTARKLCARAQSRGRLPPSSITSFAAAVPFAPDPRYWVCPASTSEYSALDGLFAISGGHTFTYACARYQATNAASQVITEVTVVAPGSACPAGMLPQGAAAHESNAGTFRFELCARFTPTPMAVRALQRIYWSGLSSMGLGVCRVGDVTLTKINIPAAGTPAQERSLCARF